MEEGRKMKTALLSVFHKAGIEEIAAALHQQNIKIYSTGGTYNAIKAANIPVTKVEDITTFPSILGGRVKTLHPRLFGGILAQRNKENDQQDMKMYAIPQIDLVVVDLYPFEETISQSTDENEIIEKIDIGGISLIRAAAKNYHDVLSIPSREYYPYLLDTINSRNGLTTLEERKSMALASFAVSSHYDSVIYNHFAGAEPPELRVTAQHAVALRYGENPHQSGTFFGNLDDVFEQLHGKALSYNNLLDLDAGIRLISDFQETTFAILKHNNACGLASRPQLLDAWKDALAGDPVSAFGGVLITNQPVDKKTAAEINKIFFEVILAPDYETEALEIFKTKKNRIILKKKAYCFKPFSIRTALNGILQQQVDNKTEQTNDLRPVTDKKPEENQRDDLIFANKVVKHSRSNAIVLVKNKQLFASGVGQTSRIDALKQAIDKANHFGFDLKGAVLASDAFFPFADSVELAHQAGITAVIQPGGSVRDKDSIEYCNKNGLAMVFTGNRHFKH